MLLQHLDVPFETFLRAPHGLADHREVHIVLEELNLRVEEVDQLDDGGDFVLELVEGDVVFNW